jgi:AAA family ATPase
MASVSEKLSEKAKQRNWLRLLLRESLGAKLQYLLYVAIVDIDLIHRTVDLKYVLSTQVVQVQYEGRMRLFSVATMSTRRQNTKDPDSDISERLGALTMNTIAGLYIVDWDTAVAIEDNLQAPASRSLSVNDFIIPLSSALSDNVDQLDVGAIDKPQSDHAYTTVGGLDEQIAQIRDLIDIPFQRPDLFCHFREFQ